MTPTIELVINANRAASDARANHHQSQLASVQADVISNAQQAQDAFNMVYNDAADAIRATNAHFGNRLNILEGKVEQILTLTSRSCSNRWATRRRRRTLASTGAGAPTRSKPNADTDRAE